MKVLIACLESGQKLWAVNTGYKARQEGKNESAIFPTHIHLVSKTRKQDTQVQL